MRDTSWVASLSRTLLIIPFPTSCRGFYGIFPYHIPRKTNTDHITSIFVYPTSKTDNLKTFTTKPLFWSESAKEECSQRNNRNTIPCNIPHSNKDIIVLYTVLIVNLFPWFYWYNLYHYKDSFGSYLYFLLKVYSTTCKPYNTPYRKYSYRNMLIIWVC